MSDIPMKRCRLCEEEKPLTEFRFKKNKTKGGLDNTRIKTCKECESKIASGLKLCPSCKVWKPLTDEYFHHSSRESSGFKGTCKACRNDKNQRQKLPEEDYQRFIYRRDMESKGFKYCPKCETFKPATTDYFYSGGDTRKDGLHGYCIDCERKAWHESQPDTPRRLRAREFDELAKQGLKRCSNCNEIKPTSSFSQYNPATKTPPKDRLQFWCDDCKRDEYRRNRSNYAFKQRIWVSHNRHKVRAYKSKYKHKRRQKEKELPYNWGPDNIKRMLDYWDNTCAICGAKPDMFRSLEYDHFIPFIWKSCPGTIPTNMIPVCSSNQIVEGQLGCNQSRQDKPMKQYLIERFGKRKANRILKRIREYFDWVREQDGDSE